MSTGRAVRRGDPAVDPTALEPPYVNDRMEVLLHEPWQVAYWTRVLEVDEAELRALVADVGVAAHLVRAALHERREAAAAAELPH